MGENHRGCIVCNVTVRLPALLCSDCDQNGYATYNNDLLVFLREDGPVEVTDAMVQQFLVDVYGEPADFMAWLRNNAHVDREKVVD